LRRHGSYIEIFNKRHTESDAICFMKIPLLEQCHVFFLVFGTKLRTEQPLKFNLNPGVQQAALPDKKIMLRHSDIS